MTIRRFVVPVVTEYPGDAEVYSPVITGKLVSFRYVKDDFASGVDFVITAETSGETLWSEDNVNASATRHPRAATHSTAGVATTYDNTRGVLNKIALNQDRVKIVISSGDEGTEGTFHITIDDGR